MGNAEEMLTPYNKKSGGNGTLKWAKLYENKRVIYNQNNTDTESAAVEEN